MRSDRRQFLQWASAASGVALVGAACDGDEPAGGSADARAAEIDAGELRTDSGSACQPTQSDAQGPFFVAGAPMRTKIAGDGEPGERLRLTGTVVGDDCAPVAGALLDVWQADATGTYHDAGIEYRLRGQVLTDADGRFEVDTIRPGNYTLAEGSWRPAHIHFTASKPGFAAVTTQLYFAGDPFLPPNDGCAGCGSDDADRVIDLTGDAGSGWRGQWRVVLLRS